jgi:predicted Ser/Thr protein kinase
MSINISHLDAFLGEGAFSWVYSLKNTPYAAKISKFNDKDLEKEFALLESLGKNNPALFPQVYLSPFRWLPLAL